MKQMSLIEMDGFLKGKCIPSDLKVNETNAEYLVRKFAEAEAKCAALAAENAMLKKRIEQIIQIINNADNDYCMCGSAMKDHVHSGCGHPTGTFDYHYNQWLDSDNKTPATDAFLSEVRAQGVDAAIEAAKNLVAQEYEYKDFKAAQSDCCMHPGSDLVGKVEMTEWLVDFAAQLRKGGNQ
ncbi:hypothetical protein E6E11_19715 [Escherichia coli]|nr:hypothetical protein [Escherichia coli]